jgi:peptidoglycan/LPS O-acetylase OafA/YrhL
VSAPSEAVATKRNDTLDGLKYVAAAMIVLHHVAGNQLGSIVGIFLYYSAVTSLFFFFAVSGYLHGAVGERGGAWRLGRLYRLGVPYAFWSLVYLVWGQKDLLLHGGPPFLPNPALVIFFAGAHGILWFLLVLLACALLSDVFVGGARSRRIGIALCVVVTLALYWSGVAGTTPPEWQNFVLASRYLLVYLGGMEIRAMAPFRAPSRARAGALVAVTIVGVGIVGIVSGLLPVPLALTLETTLWSGCVFAVLAGAASGMRWFGTARLAWGREYLIGVYLSHVIWLATFVRFVPPSSLPPALWIPAGWVFCFAGASATTWALLTIPFTRPVVV